MKLRLLMGEGKKTDSYGNRPVASAPSNKIEACSALGFDRRKLRGCKQRVPFVSSVDSP